MNATHAIHYSVNSLSLTVALLSVLGVLLLSGLAWRRSAWRRFPGLLEMLRMAIVLLGAWMLLQPEYVTEYRPTQKPTVAVLWDDSPSMLTRDVAATATTSNGNTSDGNTAATAWTTRQAAIEPWTKQETWQALDHQFEVVVESLQSAEHAHQSNLNQPLQQLVSQHSRLRAVVLVSDGDWNQGESPAQAATRLRLANVPVFAIPVGSTTKLPDLELASLDAPSFGVVGKSVRVPFTVESSLPREQTVTATLRSGTGETVSESIVLPPMARTNAALVWKPQGVGETTVTIEITPHPAETETANNRLTAPISIREEQLRVLVVESYPRWEYRYLRNALSRDPGIRLACLLFHPGLERTGGGNQDYLPAFPAGLDELSQYDVIFLGDVGLEDQQLTSEQCHWIKGVVEHQATGLVFMPGFQGRQLSLLDTELEELYPVQLDRNQPYGWGTRTPGHFELTQAGRRSLLTKLADSEDENLAVWENLPGFQWYAAVERARPGAEVLAVHADASNQFGRLPLLVTRTLGTGKILFMGTDGAWRWRRGVEDKYHYRFWGQVVRWMAYQRNMAKGESMRLHFAPDQPQLQQSVVLHANVMEPSGEPLQRGTVTARITAPSGQAETVRFQSTGEEWGAFAGTYTTHEPGRHQVILHCQETNQRLETTFFVQGVVEERPGKPARPEVLAEIAQVTQGATVPAHQIESVLQALEALPDPPPALRRIQLWCHPVTGTLLLVLLGLFWTGRKFYGLL